VSYQYTINERTGVLTIDDLSISNQYSDNPVILESILVRDDNNYYTLLNKNIQMQSGFGADFNVIKYYKSQHSSGFSPGLNACTPTYIDIQAYGIGTENLGSGAESISYHFTVSILPKDK
jgi:hypothetical protein